MRHLTLLGPQRNRPTVGAVLDELGVEGRVAVVSAGWQEREGEDDELRAEIERPGSGSPGRSPGRSAGRSAGRAMVNLALYARAERVFEEHPELLARLQERHDRRQAVEELYRRRLDHALAAARYVFAWRGDPRIAGSEREHAVEAVASLDRHHTRRVADIESSLRPDIGSYPALAREREEVRRQVAGSAALVLAGGHVVVLRNRLELFGFRELLAGYDRPVIAWSAAAMCLAETVVLFHDRPPQGAGNAEVLADGLGFARRSIVLPAGSQRLRLDDRDRVALFARRFAGRVPLVFDDGARLDLDGGLEGGPDGGWDGGRWARVEGLRRLTREGAVEPVGEVDPRIDPRAEEPGVPEEGNG